MTGSQTVAPAATTSYGVSCTGSAGAATASTTISVATQGSGSYSTSFNTAENPISEGGRWINGLVAGIDWHNMQTGSGAAYATAINGGYDDSIAVLTGIPANQWAQGTVHRVPGYSPGTNHEIELLLRFQITAHNARGYEVLWGQDGGMNIVRWNGPLGNYTPLAPDGYIGPAVEGDVLRAEIVSNQINVYRNGTLVMTVTDSTWTDGQPGIGSWLRSGATASSYGWASFSAGGM